MTVNCSCALACSDLLGRVYVLMGAHHVTDECVRDCVWMVCVRVWIRICVRASYCAWALLSVECMCAC